MNIVRAFFKYLSLSALFAGSLNAVVACGASGNDVPIGSDNAPISCASDDNCPAGKTCQDHHCQPPPSCVPAAEVCDGIDNDCNGHIDEGALCPMGQACHNGACEGPPPACVADADCAMGHVCHNGMCAPPPPACVADADCAMGQVCHNGMCAPHPPACVADADCAMGQVCHNG
ncbi:MAG: MopE-related protein, partial [Minicystis sp.]